MRVFLYGFCAAAALSASGPDGKACDAGALNQEAEQQSFVEDLMELTPEDLANEYVDWIAADIIVKTFTKSMTSNLKRRQAVFAQQRAGQGAPVPIPPSRTRTQVAAANANSTAQLAPTFCNQYRSYVTAEWKSVNLCTVLLLQNRGTGPFKNWEGWPGQLGPIFDDPTWEAFKNRLATPEQIRAYGNSRGVALKMNADFVALMGKRVDIEMPALPAEIAQAIIKLRDEEQVVTLVKEKLGTNPATDPGWKQVVERVFPQITEKLERALTDVCSGA